MMRVVFPLCQTCGHMHDELLSRNYRVYIPPEAVESPLPNRIDGPNLDRVFITNSMLYFRAVRRVVGEHILTPRTRIVVYPSQMVSIFLSNLMDMLQSTDLVVYIANKIVRPQFIQGTRLTEALQRYEQWSSSALVGGLFSHHDLMASHEHLMAFDSFKWAMEKKSFRVIHNNLQIVGAAIGKPLVDKIRSLAHSILDLLLSPLPLVQHPSCYKDSAGVIKQVPDLNVPLSPGQSSNIQPMLQHSIDGREEDNVVDLPVGGEKAWGSAVAEPMEE